MRALPLKVNNCRPQGVATATRKAKVEVGRRLGLGVMATCDGKGESVPVFKIVGEPVAKTIFIKSPPIGVLVPEDPNLK